MRWTSAQGLLGSALLLLSGLFSAKVPHGNPFGIRTLMGHLRVLPGGPLVLGMLIGLLGLLLLTWAWWGLVRAVSGRADGARLARRTAVVWALPLLVAPPLFSGDGWSYVATGYLAGHGLSPYEVAPAVLPDALSSGVARVWLNTTSPYGPVPLVWGGLFSRLTASPWLLLFAYRLLAVAGLALLAAAIPTLARRFGVDPARATALAVASPLALVHGIGGLHNDLLVAGLVATALSVTGRDRWWWGAVIAGVAAGVKVPGGAVAVGVVLLSLVPGASLATRLRRAAEVALVSGGSLLTLSVVSGLGLGWIHGLRATADAPARMAPTALVGRGVSELLRRAGSFGAALNHRLDPVALSKDLGLILLVALLGWVLLRRRVPDERAALTGAALAMLGVTLLSPALHYWYFLWCLPLLAAVPLARGPARALFALLAVLGPLAVADPALHITWLTRTAVAALVLVPLTAWLADEEWGRRAGRPLRGGRNLHRA
ncbi:MAG: hypothetical protein JWQ15_2489 [Marmoricola sp.]|nr:hypothetical protein [Marmoricola sp.]